MITGLRYKFERFQVFFGSRTCVGIVIKGYFVQCFLSIPTQPDFTPTPCAPRSYQLYKLEQVPARTLSPPRFSSKVKCLQSYHYDVVAESIPDQDDFGLIRRRMVDFLIKMQKKVLHLLSILEIASAESSNLVWSLLGSRMKIFEFFLDQRDQHAIMPRGFF